MELLRIDGAHGEGGGQILRTAAALSAATGRAVEVFNIRARRDPPGLRAQHFTAVKILSELSEAEVEGLQIGSERLVMRPKSFRSGEWEYDVGTAGSVTLILQCLIPAVSLSGKAVRLTLKGGTDVRWSPTIDYLRYVVIPMYSVLGIRCSLRLVRRGYYPKGGGEVRAEILPAEGPASTSLVGSPKPRIGCLSSCSNLPSHVAERQLEGARQRLREDSLQIDESSHSVEEAFSPGSTITVYASGASGPFIGGDAIGERGKRAELVGREAASRFLEFHKTGATLDEHAGDMVVLPMCLTPVASEFRVSRVSSHLETSLYTGSLLTGKRYSIEGTDGSGYLVRILPTQ